MPKKNKEKSSVDEMSSEVVEEVEVESLKEESKEEAVATQVEEHKKVSPTSITIKKDCQICMPNNVGRPMRIDFRDGSVVTQKNVIVYILRNHSDIFEV